MKNILLFLLLSAFAFGQDISPYYPAKQTDAWRGLEPTQLTYYDEQYVQGAVSNFMSLKMGMTSLESQDTDWNTKAQFYSSVFQDRFSTGKIKVTYYYDKMQAKVFFAGISETIENPAIIKSLKITGTPNRVIAFFVEYWGSNLDFNSIKADVERKQMQDVAKFYYNKGKPYIIIENNTYKSTKEFEDFFNLRLQENTNLHK